MNCPRCRSTSFQFVCHSCGLLTPRAIQEVSAVMDELRPAASAPATRALLLDEVRQRLAARHVLPSADIDAFIAHVSHDAVQNLSEAAGRIVAIPPERIAAATRPRRGQREAGTAADEKSTPRPASEPTTAAQDYRLAALKLKFQELLYTFGFAVLTLVFLSATMRALIPALPLIPLVAVAWTVYKAFELYRVWRTDADTLWQREVNPVSDATPSPLERSSSRHDESTRSPAEVVQHRASVETTRTPTAPVPIRWTPDDLRRAQAGIPWSVGDVLFGWYRIDAIRTGGFGAVYLCRHTETGEGQAIKTVLLNPLTSVPIRDGMKREAEVWAALPPHPNVVVCDFLQTSPLDKRLWIGMERVNGNPERGATLSDWLQRGPIGQDDAVRIIGGICDGMHHVAASGLLHRDLKPANVLITDEGFAKVSDFGLAQPLSHTGEGTLVAGTPSYMSPEAWSPDTSPSPARDVYAFGVILWEILTNRHPFALHANDMRLAHALIPPADPRTINPSAHSVLSQMAMDCLSKAADARPTFAALLHRLKDAFPDVQWSECGTRAGVGIECNRISALISVGELPEAERRLNALLARTDSDQYVLIHAERVNLFKALGRLPDARDSLRRLADMTAVSAGMLLVKSDANRDIGQYERALECLEEALALEPDHGWILYRKGLCLEALGRYVEAEQALNRAADAPTESAVFALVALAGLHLAHGRTSIALECLTRALARNPNDERTLCTMAQMLEQIEHREAALQCVDRALSLNAEHTDAQYLKAGLLRGDGRADDAVDILRALAARTPPHLRACAELAVALNATAPDESRRYLDRVAQATCHTSSDHLSKALVLAIPFELWRPALVCVDAALTLDPTSAAGWCFKAELHTYLDELDAAASSYQHAKTHAPTDQQIDRRARALASFVEGQRLLSSDPERALAAFNRARDDDRTNFRYAFAEGMALRQLKRAGQALFPLDEGFQLAPRSAALFLRMIRIECLSALHLVEDAQAAARELMPMVKEDADRVFVERVLAADRPPISREQLAAHWQTQGIHAQRADRLEEAIEMHSRAVYITPNDSVRKGGLALCLVIRGCKTSDPSLEADGLRLFEQALSIRRDPTTLFNYAQALRMVWRRAEALSVVQEVLRSSPDDPLAQALLKELREPAVH